MKTSIGKWFGLTLVALCGYAASIVLAAPATVFELTGTVQAIPGAGSPKALRKGDAVEQGETVVTGENSSVVLRFEDGQVAALSARSRMTVTTYNYNKADVAKSNIFLTLVEGGMRAITGLIGKQKPSQVAYRAGNATIGIRGTDVTIAVNGGVVAVTVTEGEITITYDGKSVTIPASQGWMVSNGKVQSLPADQIIASISAQGTPAAMAVASALQSAKASAIQQAVQSAAQSQSQTGQTSSSTPTSTPLPTGTGPSSSGSGGGSASTR